MNITITPKGEGFVIHGLQSHGMTFTGEELVQLMKDAADAWNSTVIRPDPNPIPKKFSLWRSKRSKRSSGV